MPSSRPVPRLLGLTAILGAVAAGALWWSVQPEPEPPPPPPNVLIVLWDTVRADRLSVYGYDKPTTPRLEALAADATVFERAISPGIWTLPSHAALFTGLPPESTGADERWMWLDEQHTTLAEHFSDHGYATFSFAANALLAEGTNLVQGFDVALNTWKGRARRFARQATERKLLPNDRSNELSPLWEPPAHGAKNAEWAQAMYKEAAPIIGEGLIRWLDRRGDDDGPWLAYLNFMEAHTPRIPAMEARRKVMDDDAIALSLRTDQAHINLHFYNFGKYTYTDAELAAINGVYDATLVELDEVTGRLLDALEKRDLLEDTIVVIVSDHGENLGDHGMFNHRFGLWDTLAHVPLIVRYPKGMAPGRVAEAVSTQDVFATLLQLTGLPEPAGPPRGPGLCRLDGAGACPDARPRPPRTTPPVTTMALPLEREIKSVQQVHPDVEIGPWLRSGHAIHGQPHKLVRYDGGDRALYDVAADPGEREDLLARLPGEAARLEEALDARNAGVPPYDPKLRTDADEPRNVRASQAELRSQLEALGYIQDE